MYIVKTNYPPAIHNETQFRCRRDALRRFERFRSLFDRNREPYKLFIRNDATLPLRGTIQVEHGGFFYYVELFRQP